MVITQNTWRILAIISDRLHNVKFNWVPKDLNRVAHVLAKWSLNNYLASIFVLGYTPDFVDVILLEQNLNLDM